MTDIKKLIESIDKIQFANTAQKPGDQVRGTDNPPFKGRLVGEEGPEDKFLGKPYIREDESDNLLEHLSAAYRELSTSGAYSPQAKEIFKKSYDMLRKSLMAGNVAAFKDDWRHLLGMYPDQFSELADAMFISAGLDHHATFDEFMDKVNAINEDETGENYREECPACYGSGREETDPEEVCYRCGGKGHLVNGEYDAGDNDIEENYLGRMEGGSSGIVEDDEEQEEHGPYCNCEDCCWARDGKQICPSCGCTADQCQGHSIEEDAEQTPLTYEDVVAAWKQVFPHSSVGVAKAFGGGYTFKFRLSKDKTEVSNGIPDNDPLSYSALLDTDGTFKEYNTHMSVKPPEGANLVYGSEKFRKKTIKNATVTDLAKRFGQVYKFVDMFADKMKDIKFDINEKLGKNITEDEEYSDDDIRSPNFQEELYDGCYVRDEQNDGPRGEIFKMSGDPYSRRVRIEDKDGRGWNISSSRLTKVDDEDSEIQDWFPSKGSEDPDEYIGPSKRGTKKPSWQTDESLDEAKKPMTIIAKLKKAKADGVIHSADQISRDKEGNFIFRKSFYYRHGISPDSYAHSIGAQLTDAGFDYEILDKGEHYAGFRGGASIKQSSHWWVKVQLLADTSAGDSLDEAELSDLERNKALAGARITDPNSESRGIWMQHYRRALGNKQNDAQARTYADMMTRTEPKFAKESIDISLEDITEELKAAFEDYVSNEKYSDNTLYPSKSKKPSVDKKKVKAPKVVDQSVLDETGPIGKKRAENRALWNKVNRKGVVAPIDRERYTDLSYQGLEGPFRTKTGGVLYYDPKEGKYYDRDRDMYVDYGLDEAKHATGARSLLLRKLADIERTNPGKIKEIQDKFQDLTMKLSDVKKELDNKVGKVEEDFPTSMAPAGTQTDPTNPNTGEVPATGTNPKPIAAQPQTTSQQVPVPAGTPTAAPGKGQPTPPTAGQAGGAPTTNIAGAPQPPVGGQVNAATTPEEQLKGLVQTMASNPVAAKQLATKMGSSLR